MSQNRPATQFVVCLDNTDYEASLEVGKLYRVVSDEQAHAHGYLRVIDESGDDYAFSARRFHPIEIPKAVEEALATVMQ